MKHIKKFEEYVILNEGLKSENVINMMTDIILQKVNYETIVDNMSKYKQSLEYSYKTIFGKYKDNEFIKQMFVFFKENDRNPKIIFRFEQKFNYQQYQHSKNEPNGFYNADTSDIQINIYAIMQRNDAHERQSYNEKQIKQTLAHELRHMYDDVVRKGTNSQHDKEDSLSYKDKPSEVRARISGFINSYTGWDNSIDEIVNDAVDAIRTDNYNRKKLLKLLYTLKKTGLDKHTIIPIEKANVRKSDIEGFVQEMEKYGLYNYYEKDHRVIDISSDILSINTIDEDSGELGYPLLEMLLDIYDKKNLNITTKTRNLELVDIIKNKYKRNIIMIREKPANWNNRVDLKIKFLLSKSGKIPHYEKVSDVKDIDYEKLSIGFERTYQSNRNENLEKYCKDLGLSESYMIKLLQTIIDKNRYFYLLSGFYEKYEHLLNLKDVSVHYFEKELDDKLYKIYIINGDRDKQIYFDKLKDSTNFKKIK